jgi:hypothetical protein
MVVVLLCRGGRQVHRVREIGISEALWEEWSIMSLFNPSATPNERKLRLSFLPQF